MKHISVLFVAGLAAIGLSVSAAPDLSKLPAPAKQSGVTFATDIEPILKESCLQCHGAQRPKAGLRLDSLEAVLKGSKDRKVILPGDSGRSLLVIAVARLDEKSAMPPKPRQGRGGAGGPGNRPPTPLSDTNAPARAEGGTNQITAGPRGPMGPPPKPLTMEQVALIRAWVDQGAH